MEIVKIGFPLSRCKPLRGSKQRDRFVLVLTLICGGGTHTTLRTQTPRKYCQSVTRGTKKALPLTHETNRHYASLFPVLPPVGKTAILRTEQQQDFKSCEPCLDSKGTRYYLFVDNY